MKKTLFLIILLLVTCHLSLAQCPDCEIVTLNGQRAYVYEVKKGEGLYRIGVNFGVSQEEIIRLNPVLKNSGLRLGQKIYVPVVEHIDSTEYVVHIIQPKETLYGLSKQYGVRVADLQELNPVLSKNMPIGGHLLIKKKETVQPTPGPTPDPTPAPAPEPAQEDPIAVQTPTPEPAQEPVVVEPPADTIKVRNTLKNRRDKHHWAKRVLNIDNDSVAQDSAAQIVSTPIRLAFMLPFQVNAMRRTVKENRFIEFYEGALLAIYEAQAKGQIIEVYVYDTEKSEEKVRRLLDPTENPEIQLVDAVIGPTYNAQVAACYDFALSHQTYFLFPFADKISNLQTNPYFLQFNPSEEQKKGALQDWLIVNEDSTDLAVADSLYQVSAFKKQIIGDAKRMRYKLLRDQYFADELQQQDPRYDLLGYDLTCFIIQVLQTKATEEDFDLSTILYEGIQSDLQFLPVSPNGGYQNIGLKVYPK